MARYLGKSQNSLIMPRNNFSKSMHQFYSSYYLNCCQEVFGKDLQLHYSNLTLSEQSLEKRPGSVWDSVSIFGKLLP